MSGGTKKEETKQQTNQTVELPAWMTQAGQQLYGQAQAENAANPVRAYSQPITADLSANQALASQRARQSQGSGQGDLATARMMTGAAATGTVPDINAGTFGEAEARQYMSPFIGEVQSRTLDEMQRRNAMETQGLRDASQQSGAFGGTRDAVLQAETGKAQNMNMLDYLAQSNEAAYQNAQGQFNTDRGARVGAETTNNSNRQMLLSRLLEAGGQAASIGGLSNSMATADIDNLARTGAVEQATQGDARSSAYQEFLRNQGAGMDRIGQMTGILSGQPRNVTTNGNSSGTSTVTQSGGLLNALLGGGQIAASIFSDRRLKRDIEQTGMLADGLGMYRYRYVWSDAVHHGVMADEVAALRPWALGPTIGGYATVDYSKLGATA